MRKINTEFAKVCIKKDGRISQRARYLFETDKEIGRYYLDSDVVVLHPWHVSSGRGFSTVVDNIELIREILRSVKCAFTEGNDAPRGGHAGQFIRFTKSSILGALQAAFGSEKGRALYVDLGLSVVLSEQTIEDLKGMTASQAYMLSAYYKDAWEVLHGHKSKDRCIAIFPDETSWAIPFLLLIKGE